MMGLVLVHVAGRASNSVVELENTTHLIVFFGGLSMLAGLGLLGRNDLGMRIPNALEGVVYLAALDRIICILVGGEVPLLLISMKTNKTIYLKNIVAMKIKFQKWRSL